MRVCSTPPRIFTHRQRLLVALRLVLLHPSGHGADMRCVDWHPHKSIIISGSKDSQQPIKLWDARSGASLATM